jgi:acyl carrier protein
MTKQLDGVDTARLRRGGVLELSSEDGLALLDTALRGSAPLLVPMRLDARSLSVAAESVPPLLQGLVRVTSRASRAAASGLKQRLAGLSAVERERLLLDLVRSTAATVLSASVESVEPERALQELGLDSLMAVELCNRLSAATGLRLPATSLFDYPTPKALTEMLAAKLDSNSKNEAESASLLGELRRITSLLARVPATDPNRKDIAVHLRAMLSTWSSGHSNHRPRDDKTFDAATDDSLFDLIDQKIELLDLTNGQ